MMWWYKVGMTDKIAHSSSPAFSMNAVNPCELREISHQWRKQHPQATQQDILYQAVKDSGATSFAEAVHGIHASLVAQKIIGRSACR
jgi:hypothetical protein